MAVAHDGEANLSARESGTDPWTASGKTTAGSNRVGVVRVMGLTAVGAPSAVTWNGAAMTLIGSLANVRDTADSTFYAYYIVAPPTGASDVVIDWGGINSGCYSVTSYNGVDQTTPVSGLTTAAGTSGTASVAVTSSIGDMVLDMVDVLNVTTVDGSQTQEADLLGGLDEFGASRKAGAASVTMQWTQGSADWDILAFSLNQVAAGDPEGSLTGGKLIRGGLLMHGVLVR